LSFQGIVSPPSYSSLLRLHHVVLKPTVGSETITKPFGTAPLSVLWQHCFVGCFQNIVLHCFSNQEASNRAQGRCLQAEVAFIDEVFKANSAILNTLLTLLNERLFDNGNQRLPVPLVCLVAASNELPESEELDALYDRFLIRCSVKQVRTSTVHRQ
jgi:hypothetical protein